MNQQSVISPSLSTTDVNKMLKNTYMLLAMTLAFSAVTAGLAMAINLGPMMSLGLSLGSLVLLFVTLKKADSAAAIFWVFAFTGMQGASLGDFRITVGLCTNHQKRLLIYGRFPICRYVSDDRCCGD